VPAAAVAGANNAISFKNFDQSITLHAQNHPAKKTEPQAEPEPGKFEKIQFYRVQGAGHPGAGQTVAVSNRLIVKTAAAVGKDQLRSYHRQIVKVTELYTGIHSRYYSVEIKKGQMLATVLTALQGNPNIELVQPDILQLKHESDDLSSAARQNPKGGNASPYLSLLDVPSLWKETKGKGVRIAIIDDGINLQHPDLQHIEPVFAYDSELRQLSSAPLSNIDGHGTRVAGIIFAAHNHIGIDGIAPEADLIALRQPDTWTSNTLLSFQLARLARADIINCSWHSSWLLQPVAEVVEELAIAGRDGKGLAVVFSAGNSGQKISHNQTEAAIAGAIVVGAGNEMGEPMNFSNYGPAVDLFVYGKSSTSTARDGGYARFAGTSLAAAITSGYIALLLAQDNELTLDEIIGKMQNLAHGN